MSEIIIAYNPRTFERFAFDSDSAFEIWVNTNSLKQGKVHPTNFHTQAIYKKVSEISGEYIQFEVNRIPLNSGTVAPLVEHPKIIFSHGDSKNYVKLVHEVNSPKFYLHWRHELTPNSTASGVFPYYGDIVAKDAYNSKHHEIFNCFPQEE